jgi:dipeptidyl aminopeptidase/acylaminoacyl peptidase
MDHPVIAEVPEHHHEPVPEDVYASWSPSPSPDGQHVAFVTDRTGAPAVWIEGAAVRQLRPLPARLGRVSTVHWSPDGQWLAAQIAAPGASRTEVWAVRPDGSDAHLVAGEAPGTAVLGGGSWHGWTAQGQLLVTAIEGGSAQAMLVDVKGDVAGDVDDAGGRREVLAHGPLLHLLDVSEPGERGSRRALLRAGARGATWLEVAEGSSRTRVMTGGATGFTDRGFLSPDGSCVYAISNAGREFAALVQVDLSGQQPPRVLAERPDAELQDAVRSSDGCTALLVWNVYGGRSAVSLLDLVSGIERRVPALPRDVIEELRFRPDGLALLATAQDWADPRGIWSIDLTSFEATPLSSRADGTLRASQGATPPVVRAADLTSPQLRRLTARDGLELTGWFYQPEGPGPWPSIVYLHGGPESQERPVYNSLFQSLVAAGIAVFALNFRGSSGFGRSFQAADDLEKRFAAITDVADAAQDLISSGIAAPGRLGCMGRSYGGYLTLAALVWHPELFAAGVDVCGMASFDTFYQHTEPWIGAAAYTEYGHPVHDAELLRSLSPIHRMDRLTAPLLIVHGAEDTNVPVQEAEQVVAALRQRGVEHRYMLFEGEGHELLATPNRVAFVHACVDWLTRHLGAEPLPGAGSAQANRGTT